MNVVVIGGVAAGMSAAAKLKRTLGDAVNIVVFEKGNAVSYAACGIPFYVADIVKDPDSLSERTPKQFAESGIDVKLGHEAVAVDTAAKTVTVRDLEQRRSVDCPYDKLIVASGARVRKVPPLDVERENLHMVRNIEDGIAIKGQLSDTNAKNVVVVGAGFIGLEMAEACVRNGKHVLVVEFAERILSTMDPEITDRLAAELKRNTIRVRVDSKVTDLVCSGGRITSVVIECRGSKETVPADMVINCSGIIPNTEFIDVEKADNGAIMVNERMETSAPDVYAAGDCSVMNSFVTGKRQYVPLGTNANKQGRIIAEVLAGKPAPRFRLVGSSALRLFAVDVAKVGLSEIDAQKLNLDYKANLITGSSYASYYSAEEVVVKIIYDAKTRKLLGAQTLGQGVVAARANYYAIAISAGMTVDEFGFLDLCYSPPFSGVWDATLIAANTAR